MDTGDRILVGLTVEQARLVESGLLMEWRASGNKEAAALADRIEQSVLHLQGQKGASS